MANYEVLHERLDTLVKENRDLNARYFEAYDQYAEARRDNQDATEALQRIEKLQESLDDNAAQRRRVLSEIRDMLATGNRE